MAGFRVSTHTTERNLFHPAVVAYRDILEYKSINATQAELIANATGAELDTAPDTWLQFLKELAATGNKHTHNIQVMVAAFMHYQSGARLSEALDLAWTQHKGEIPQGGQSNGKHATRKTDGEKLAETFDRWRQEDLTRGSGH